MNNHIYECDKLMVGGSLSSLIYAYHHAYPIIWTEPKIPYFFDKTKDGHSKLEIWKRTAFLLSMAGLAPMGDKATSYRKEDGLLKVFGKEPYFISFRANNIIYHDKDLVEKENSVFEVIDWVSVRSGMSHRYDVLETKDDFVRRVHFYKSNRICGDHDLKDAVVLSYMTRQQLQSDDFSETYIRLKLRDLMKKAGIKGTGNGIFQGKQKFLSLRLEPSKREIRIPDTKREDRIIKKYLGKEPPHEQAAMWADILGSPYD